MVETYEQASGQHLNKEKASILFSHNTKEQIRRQILSAFDLQATLCIEKY
jgi:hypothetical protein